MNSLPAGPSPAATSSADLRKLFPLTLPVWPVDDDGRCTCPVRDCRRPGKHADASAPEDSPAYAVLAGPGGVLVVDVDVKGEVDGFKQLEPWDLPTTFEVETPSGGRHLYFNHPGGELTNKKLDTAIDVRANKRNDGGYAYVVGPGSPGYVKTSDPCVVAPADPYTVIEQGPRVDAPKLLVSFLKIDAERESTSPVTPIDATHPAWSTCIMHATADCKTYEPSREDGSGSANMMAIVRRLVRRYQLPNDKALELLNEHWNPRCTKSDGVTPYPWDDAELIRALDNSRARGPGDGMADDLLARAEGRGLLDKVRLHPKKPEGLRGLAAQASGRKHPSPAHVYSHKPADLASNAEADKVSFNDIVSHFAKHPDWLGVWQHDDFKNELRAVDPPLRLDAETNGFSPGDLADLRAYLNFQGILATDKDIQQAVTVAARGNRFHPVREYLASLPAGDPTLFRGLALKLFGDGREIASRMLEKQLVASVRRILTPGCQVDSTLILHGPEQGRHKTKAVEAFYVPWCRRGIKGGFDNRDSAHSLEGFWGIELGELTSLLKNEAQVVKDFLTVQVDNYRQFGNGQKVSSPRQCVFWGTTNDDYFLRDPTGNRRFWTISIPDGHDIPVAWILEHRDELWAAALVLAHDETYPHYFDKEVDVAFLKQLAKEHEEQEPTHDAIAKYLEGRDVVTCSDIFIEALGGTQLVKLEKRDEMSIARTLKRLECKPCQFGARNTRGWRVPEAIAKMPRAVAARTAPVSMLKRPA